jgi:hypothetical protein
METITTLKSEEQSLTESGFYWRERNGVKNLVCRALEEKGFANGFSTRLGGVSAFPENSLNLAGFDEDSSDNIYENRRKWKQSDEYNDKLETASGRMTLVFRLIGKDWKAIHLHTSPDNPPASRPVLPSERENR